MPNLASRTLNPERRIRSTDDQRIKMKRKREEDNGVVVEQSMFYDGRDWVRGEKLGQGGFGSVHLAHFPCPGGRFKGFPPFAAVKSASADSWKELSLEKAALDGLRGCPSVVRCLGDDITVTADGRPVLNLFLEYARGGSLLDLVNDAARAPGSLLEPQASRFAKSILLGLREIHGLGLVHCDIKLENVLLFDDNDGGGGDFVARIADFGLAKSAGDQERPAAGTKEYWAPEVAREGVQGPAADVWALGCVVFAMLTWSLPSSDPPAVPYGVFSAAAEGFVRKCFWRNPERRPSAEELLRHPFVCDDHLSRAASQPSDEDDSDFIPISSSEGEEEEDDEGFDEERMKPVAIMSGFRGRSEQNLKPGFAAKPTLFLGC